MIDTSVYLDELDERELAAPAAAQRARPDYPTFGPAWLDGVSHAEHFKHLKSAYAEPEVAEPVSEIEILQEGYDLEEPLKAPGAPGTLARRLAGQEWTVRVRASRVAVPAKLYVSDSDEDAAESYRKGDVRFPAHELETFALLGVKRAGGEMLAVDATWERKVGGSMMFQGATTHDPYLGTEWRLTSRKPRPQRDWEKADGVAAPLGLDQWLALVAPKPETKRKGKA